jgi:hypothetical protein
MGKLSSDNVRMHPVYCDYRDIARCWMLQLLVPLGAHKGLIKERHCTEDEVLHELGLSHLLEAEDFKENEASVGG